LQLIARLDLWLLLLQLGLRWAWELEPEPEPVQQVFEAGKMVWKIQVQ